MSSAQEKAQNYLGVLDKEVSITSTASLWARCSIAFLFYLCVIVADT